MDIDFTAQKQVLPQSIEDKVMAVRQQIIEGAMKVEIYQGE
ncbi:MAG: hypothetical protein NTV33_10415 [Coprothermobacterota bacterium]|nr:hypothetical protein [Coprothermobacterota bacterium]